VLHATALESPVGVELISPLRCGLSQTNEKGPATEGFSSRRQLIGTPAHGGEQLIELL